MSDYKFDNWTTNHLEKWAIYTYGYGEYEGVMNAITEYLKTLDTDEVEYALSKGWQRIYETTQIGQSK